MINISNLYLTGKRSKFGNSVPALQTWSNFLQPINRLGLWTGRTFQCCDGYDISICAQGDEVRSTGREGRGVWVKLYKVAALQLEGDKALSLCRVIPSKLLCLCNHTGKWSRFFTFQWLNPNAKVNSFAIYTVGAVCAGINKCVRSLKGALPPIMC